MGNMTDLTITEEQYQQLEDKLLRAASVDDLLSRLRDSVFRSPTGSPVEPHGFAW